MLHYRRILTASVAALLVAVFSLGMTFDTFAAEAEKEKTGAAAKRQAGAESVDKPKVTEKPAALSKPVPQSAEDLLAIQEAVQKTIQTGLPATVGLRIGNAQGSGVIVSGDGYILTAGHVAGAPERDVTVIFADGKRAKAKTLGLNRDIDSGMIKLTDDVGPDKKPWPHVELAKSGPLKPGAWCVALGHPNGFQTGRPPVARVGRVVQLRRDAVWTDCPLVGGDSGGPLFDLDGRVIGIHSRISGPVTANFHVPIDTYHETWDRLKAGEAWGGPPPRGGPVLGINGEPDIAGCKITGVAPGLPAEKAGLKPGDIITRVGDDTVKGLSGLQSLLAKKKAGDEVSLSVLRGEEKLTLTVTLVKRE